MVQAWWCEQALCAMAEHCFTRLSVAALHRSDITKRILWVMFVFFRIAVSLDFLFMDENTCPHRNAAASKALETDDINRTQCLAYSAELNHIERAWDTHSRGVSERIGPPQAVQELKITLREKFDNISLRLLDILANSMNNRGKICDSVLRNNIPYGGIQICFNPAKRPIFCGCLEMFQ